MNDIFTSNKTKMVAHNKVLRKDLTRKLWPSESYSHTRVSSDRSRSCLNGCCFLYKIELIRLLWEQIDNFHEKHTASGIQCAWETWLIYSLWRKPRGNRSNYALREGKRKGRTFKVILKTTNSQKEGGSGEGVKIKVLH